MSKRTAAVAWSLFILVGTAPAGAADVALSALSKETGKLAVATSLAYAPFEFTDSDGQPAGVDIELANAAAALMGVEVDYVVIPFTSQIPALASKRVQVSWSSFSVTKERLSQVDFVTFLQAGTVAAALPANAGRFRSEAGLCGARVAVASGTAADFVADSLNERCATDGLAAIEKQIYPEIRDVLQATISGRADAMLDDSHTAAYFQTTSNGQLVVASERSFNPLPIGVAIAKGDGETAEMMRQALQALIDDGTYLGILERYNMAASAITRASVITNPSQVLDK